MFTPGDGSPTSAPDAAAPIATIMPPKIVSPKPARIAAHAVHGRQPASPATRGSVAVAGCGSVGCGGSAGSS